MVVGDNSPLGGSMSELQKQFHIPALDGWRGLAILFVLIGHFGGERLLPGLSSAGVDLFFVLSGRLMAEILFMRKIPLRLFIFRRFSRVYPVLLVFVLATSIALSQTPLSPGVTGVLSALTFTLNYVIIESHTFISVFDHIWSLCVEEHSYLLLVIVALLFRNAAIRSIGLIILALGFAALANGIVQYDIYGRDPFAVFWPTDVAAAPIMISAAFFLLLHKRLNRPVMQWIVPLAFIGGLAACLFGGPAWIFFGAKTLLLAIAVCAIGISTDFSRAVFEGAVIRQIGRMSFSLYIWQQPFFIVAVKGLLSQPLALGLGICCGALSFYLIEQPARARLNGWIGKGGTPSAITVAS